MMKERLSSLDAACATISRLHQWLRDRLGIVMGLSNALIKEFVNMGSEDMTRARRSYEAVTAFMMGYNHEQYKTKQTKDGVKKQ
nr:hypothetical protein [Candidatus Sigynarchaeota archaeon]